MPRPRIHDLDHVMDVAEQLAIDGGPAAVTVRGLSEAAEMSNGAIYHAFRSRSGLVGRVWLRAARRFLELQATAVDEALADGETAVDAVVAAADSPARFLIAHPSSARFLLDVRRSELLGTDDIPDQVAEELRALEDSVTALLIRLARAQWDRADRVAVDVIRDCVVELPAALLLRGRRNPDPPTRERLAVAVRAVVELGPPARTHQP